MTNTAALLERARQANAGASEQLERVQKLQLTIANLQPVPRQSRPWLFRLGVAVAIASAFAAGAFIF